MVCSMLAVVSARLDAKYGVELLKSEAGLKALAQALAQVMGGVPVIQRNGETAYLTAAPPPSASGQTASRCRHLGWT